ADILLFKATQVPVGKDQIQHIEMARDIALRFNYLYGEYFVIPEAVVDEKAATLLGLDGRKMSKSYQNTIPLFEPETKLKKLINKIKTNSLLPGEAKDSENCNLLSIYRAFANQDEMNYIQQRYLEGIGWGEMKQILFDKINQEIKPARERYQQLLTQPELIETQLQQGAIKARAIATPFLQQLRQAVGIAPIGN
ncbi:MAG: hypothetical protein RL637_308, partial [Pseudomonadota bacterium]